MRAICLLAPMLLTGAAQAQEHVSIVSEAGRSVRLTLVDASGGPLANEQVELRELQCVPAPCRSVVTWSHRAATDGSVDIPRTLIHEGTSVATPQSEPRELKAARWRQKQGWVLGLMGHAGSICTDYDDATRILVSGDWRSALVNGSDEFGLMACHEGKDAFRDCAGPQVPDAGLAATFTRVGETTAVRLTGESIAGPRELARLACWRLPRGEPPPRHPRTFALEYGLTGGDAGLDRHLRLTHAGVLDISANSKTYATVLHSHAGPELMNAVAAFLGTARLAQLPAPPTASNVVDTTLALIAGGARYELDVPRDLAQRLSAVLTSRLGSAVLGSWRQSEWKLCRPAGKLAADQVDAPIDQLAFQADGGFSVTWRGGGARVYDDPSGARPHSALPDYSGRYDIDPDRGRIRLTFENGISKPRDFAGDGFFRVAGDTLRLSRVWLGTFKAKERPDICELSFVRIGG